MKEQEINWTMVIKPRKKWFDINLKDIWRYRDLIALFVRRDFVSQFKQTILGPIWFLIQPLITTLMFVFVFGNIAGIPTDGVPKILFYMTGLLGWNYFSKSITSTSNTFVANASIFGKVYFPRLCIPISVVLSNFIHFFIQFAFLTCFMIYYKITGADFTPNIYILLLPLLLLIMAALGLGFGILISSLTTKYRDLTHLVTFGVQLWMYMTPIIFPLSEIHGTYRTLILLNPMTSIVESFKYALLGAGSFEWFHLIYSGVFAIIILGIGILSFNRVEQSFMDTV